MKRLIVCICIMTAIVIYSLWGIFQVNSLRKDFDDLIAKSESLVLQEDYSLAGKYLKEFTDNFEKKKQKISYVCNNEDLTEISMRVSMLEFQLYSSPECYFENCLALRNKISSLIEREIPDFEGIF